MAPSPLRPRRKRLLTPAPELASRRRPLLRETPADDDRRAGKLIRRSRAVAQPQTSAIRTRKGSNLHTGHPVRTRRPYISTGLRTSEAAPPVLRLPSPP